MNDNLHTVREFIETWSTLDAERLTSYFADNAIYHNMPMEAVVGRDNIRAFIDGFLATWTGTNWEIRNIIAVDNIVIAERLDKTQTTDGNVDLPCVGVFEMEGGKIKIWRDYFDMATYVDAMKS